MCRAVDQDGEVVDVFLKARRDGKAAKRFFKCLLMNHTDEPRKIVTDKLRSYGDKNIRKFRVRPLGNCSSLASCVALPPISL